MVSRSVFRMVFNSACCPLFEKKTQLNVYRINDTAKDHGPHWISHIEIDTANCSLKSKDYHPIFQWTLFYAVSNSVYSVHDWLTDTYTVKFCFSQNARLNLMKDRKNTKAIRQLHWDTIVRGRNLIYLKSEPFHFWNIRFATVFEPSLWKEEIVFFRNMFLHINTHDCPAITQGIDCSTWKSLGLIQIKGDQR